MISHFLNNIQSIENKKHLNMKRIVLFAFFLVQLAVTNAQKWTNCGDLEMKQISVGSDGTAWAVTTGDLSYKWNGVKWECMSSNDFVAYIACGSESNTWGLTPDGQILKWNSQKWTNNNVPELVKDLKISGNGIVWGLRLGDGQAMRWNATKWAEKNPGNIFKIISLAKDGNPWAIDTKGTLWRWVANKWESVGSGFKDISAGSTTLVWAVNIAGETLKWENNSFTKITPTEKIATIVTVMTESGTTPKPATWAIAESGQVWTIASTNWSKTVAGDTKTKIFIGGDGSVWSIDQNNISYRIDAK